MSLPAAVPQLDCPKCKRPLEAGLINQPALSPCPSCSTPLQVEIYPALFRPQASGRDSEVLILSEQASCFYHPQKKAVIPCDHCGRFLCARCDCELQGQHFCPGCLEAGRKEGRLHHLEKSRTLYGNIALALAFYPMLIFWLTIITAPISLVVALRFWNAPRSLVRPTRTRNIAAIILAGLQIVGWAVGIYFLSTTARRRHG